MYLKRKRMKAISICLYVITGLCMVTAACFFALSNSWYWLFFLLGIVSLYSGFVLTSAREKTEAAEPENSVAAGQNTKAKKGKTVGNQPFYKTKPFLVMCIAFVMIFVSAFSAMCFETSGFSVKVSDFTLTRDMTHYYNGGEINGKKFVMENDTSYAVTMYVPESATEEHPAATVFVLPGFTRTKATMSQYCMELSRRGAVVFCMDPGGQGGTTETSTTGANGIEYLVQYVYNNTDDFKFCDKNRFGAVGHSAGGGNVCTLAADMAGKSYEESIIKAVYISGYIKTSSANKYKNLNCNAAMSYAYYDEGAFRYQTDTSAFEVISLRFINEVGGKKNNYDKVAFDYGYGDMADGTYRIVHREKINHCFEMYDKTSIENTINFFDETLEMNSGKDGSKQIWFGKELSNGIALAAAFTFIISLCAVLMKLPFFAAMKDSKDKEQSERALSAAQAMTGGKMDTVHQTVAHKIIFWSCMLLTAIIACLDYIPLAHLSIQIFPTGNSSSVFTYVFPARMINAILLWAAINGVIGLVIFFATTLLENLYEYICYKVKGRKPEYEWDKFKAIKISGNKWSGVLLNTVKAVLLALIMFGMFYLLVWLSYALFHQDFRFMLISAAPLNKRMFVTALEYMPIIFIFYISNSIRVNCSIGREGWSEGKVMLVGALANSVGLAFILLINYVCYFATGAPFYGYWGNGVEVWLYVNMVFGLVVMMFLLPIFHRLFYKITGNVWTGAVACCMIFIMMTISASVSYIPMY